jgi:hypothetical protein
MPKLNKQFIDKLNPVEKDTLYRDSHRALAKRRGRGRRNTAGIRRKLVMLKKMVSALALTVMLSATKLGAGMAH